MFEQELQLPMPGGVADAVLFTPDELVSLPGVLHLPDIASIREAQRDMARRLAAKGYAVLLPNIFYRTRRPPVFDFPRVPGEERTVKRFAELTTPLTPENMALDAGAYIDHLFAQKSVRQGLIGVVGYCFGGGFSLRTAAARPLQVAAAASFHGGGLYKPNDETSPHLLLPQVKARLYFGHAVEDKSMNAEAINEFEHALRLWSGKSESEVYDGARHGWTVPDNPAFNPPQAARAFEKLTELFAATLA